MSISPSYEKPQYGNAHIDGDITSAMVRAGADALRNAEPFTGAESLAVAVYRAMYLAEKN